MDYCLTHKVLLSRSRFGIYLLPALVGLAPPSTHGAWEDKSVGLPPIEVVSGKTMGGEGDKMVVMQDSLGRIFVGGKSLLVFDGRTWSSHAKPGDYPLRALVPGNEGIIWATSNNAVGFFREETLGNFKYHSLRAHLPDDARDLGMVWSCAPVGQMSYFICQDKVLRWDGERFQISRFTTALRLAPFRVGDEHWFHHMETGLYRLTETGPELKFTPPQLPTRLIMGAFNDETGLVTVSNDGLVRAGQSAAFSSKALNDLLTQHRVSAFQELPDGNLVIGTVFGGLVLANRQGELIRTWPDASSGLPGSLVLGLTTDPSGQILGTAPADFFHFRATGDFTLFNALNGLQTPAVTALTFSHSTLFAATSGGIYRQHTDRAGNARFEFIPGSAIRFDHLLAYGDGLLLARFGGVDLFDGVAIREVYRVPANEAFRIVPKRSRPKSFHVLERGGLAHLTQEADGRFSRVRFLELADDPTSVHETADGRLWIGMLGGGAFVYAPAKGQLTAVNDPATAQPLQGAVRIVGDDNRILFFVNGRVLQADPEGRQLRAISGLPAFNPTLVQQLSPDAGILVAYQRPAIGTGPLHGAGILSFAADGTAGWRELDIPSLGAIGSISAAALSQENQKSVLWLGGMQGILRLDYDKIPTLAPPSAPTILTMDAPGSIPTADGMPLHPFGDHRLRFRVFTGNYFQSRDWLFQTRLGTGAGEWSAATTQRAFEFTNLSEGDYRFEVRAINTAGQAGPPANFPFRILPPWYRSGRAYAGYTVALLLAVLGFIRFRELQLRARNRELEGLVNIRTAELVKANAAKDEFLAGISHEIRNPMNGVIGIAENFRTDGLDLENRRKFSLLRQCASHLSSLLEDILDFSKVQAGAIELDPKPFDLPELVESVAGITRADSEKYGIPVEVAISPAVPRQLIGDARRIRQILINFVSNALKFSGRGEVNLTVWCKPAGEGQTVVVFAISDEGPGISGEEQARLFTRFERGAAAQKGRVPGTGLGLALCKGLAEKMGGRIWLESELGRGSCFYFSAPFRVIEAPVEVAAPAAAPAAGARTALVVDDQEYNRIVLTDQLQALGFTVHATQEGQAALDAAARQAFDVIFLDFNLPGLSGVDVARGIRASAGPSAHALILATTAFTTPEKRAQCLDAGMDAFLGKPVTRERLTKALAGLAPVALASDPGPIATPPPGKSDGPADRLGNLRLLARKKGVPLAQELALYFSEMETELAQLDAAIQAEDVTEAGRVAHLLCGRCSFIFERELEQAQRQIEAAVGAARWPEAREHRAEFGTWMAAARVRLASSDPAAPPA